MNGTPGNIVTPSSVTSLAHWAWTKRSRITIDDPSRTSGRSRLTMPYAWAIGTVAAPMSRDEMSIASMTCRPSQITFCSGVTATLEKPDDPDVTFNTSASVSPGARHDGPSDGVRQI